MLSQRAIPADRHKNGLAQAFSSGRLARVWMRRKYKRSQTIQRPESPSLSGISIKVPAISFTAAELGLRGKLLRLGPSRAEIVGTVLVSLRRGEST